MSTHLTPGQRALLVAELEQRQRKLSEQLAEHLHGKTRAERAHEVMQQDGDDAPQRAPERAVANALTDFERAELESASDALARLQRGDYGRCVDCDAEIPFDRLKVEPWTRRCIDCATRRETRRSR